MTKEQAQRLLDPNMQEVLMAFAEGKPIQPKDGPLVCETCLTSGMKMVYDGQNLNN